MGLHRQPFVRDLLECVQEDGEAVCVSALRAMATEQQDVTSWKYEDVVREIGSSHSWTTAPRKSSELTKSVDAPP